MKKRLAVLLTLLAACGDTSTAPEPGADAATDVQAAGDAGDASTAGADVTSPGPDATTDAAVDTVGDAAGPADVVAPPTDALGSTDANPEAADTADAAGSPDAVPQDANVTPDAQADVVAPPPPDYPNDEALRLNQIQAKGTHNSYHVQPPETTLSDWAYSHTPLDVQASDEGVRQFELDVHLEPPTGFTVKHVPILDGETTCATFHECLVTLRGWSDAHPGHHPLFVLIEPKDDVDTTKLAGHIAELDTAILEVWPRERVLAPDDVRGAHATLREAILADGWPTLGATRGKLVVTILDSGPHREEYLVGHPTLEGRLMFVDSDPTKDYAGVMLYDDPEADAEGLTAAVTAGFIVRTRADTSHGALVEKQLARQQAALASGAHLISSDYPVPVEDIDYFLDMPGGTPSRCNPITAPDWCTSLDIEALGL